MIQVQIRNITSLIALMGSDWPLSYVVGWHQATSAPLRLVTSTGIRICQETLAVGR